MAAVPNQPTPDWYQVDGLKCREHPELFFGGNWRRAKALCMGCPVVDDCLAVALATHVDDDYGVWGGTTREERIRMRPPGPPPTRRWRG